MTDITHQILLNEINANQKQNDAFIQRIMEYVDCKENSIESRWKLFKKVSRNLPTTDSLWMYDSVVDSYEITQMFDRNSTISIASLIECFSYDITNEDHHHAFETIMELGNGSLEIDW